MSQSLVNAFFARLSTGAVSNMVGGRIFHLQGESNDVGIPGVTTTAKLPHIVFQVITNPQELAFGSVTQDATVQVDIYGKREDGAAAVGLIEQAVHTRVHGEQMAVSGHDRGVATCITRDIRSVEDEAIRSMSEYRLRATSF